MLSLLFTQINTCSDCCSPVLTLAQIAVSAPPALTLAQIAVSAPARLVLNLRGALMEPSLRPRPGPREPKGPSGPLEAWKWYGDSLDVLTRCMVPVGTTPVCGFTRDDARIVALYV